ncbi:MAG: hypothetical protein R2800_08325 [Flavipsychrobacter sp.]
MKKLLLAIALLCSFSFVANAQYNSFTITNNTSCTVYYTMYGTVLGAVPACQADYVSSVISLGPTSSVTYLDPTGVPGGLIKGGGPILGGPDMFTMIRVYHGDPNIACTTAGVADVSDCITGTVLVNNWVLETFGAGGCLPCSSSTITWNILSPTHAGITIN